MDRGVSGARSEYVALSVRRTLQLHGRPATDAVPNAVAHAHRCAAAARGARQRGSDLVRYWLRFGSGVQSSLQAPVRDIPWNLAQAAAMKTCWASHSQRLE